MPTPPDTIALAAFVVSAIAVAISGGSLALEVRRWFEAGPKINISVMADAVEIPAPPGPVDMLVITVTNRGDTPTTITHMIAFAQHPAWQLWHRKPLFTGIVTTTMQPLPYELDVNRRWMGRLNYDEKLLQFRARRQLYVGVICSHSNKNFLAKVAPKKPDIPKTIVATSS